MASFADQPGVFVDLGEHPLCHSGALANHAGAELVLWPSRPSWGNKHSPRLEDELVLGGLVSPHDIQGSGQVDKQHLVLAASVIRRIGLGDADHFRVIARWKVAGHRQRGGGDG